jgi:hypothetical protein
MIRVHPRNPHFTDFEGRCPLERHPVSRALPAGLALAGLAVVIPAGRAHRRLGARIRALEAAGQPGPDTASPVA